MSASTSSVGPPLSHIAKALPLPPSQVAPSAAALLSPSYWETVQHDLATINACLSGLEEHDAVITCRKLANTLVSTQKDAIMGRMKRIIAMRSQWMENGLDKDRERFATSGRSGHNNNNGGAEGNSVPFSSTRYFCEKTLEKLAQDHSNCVWQSEPIPLEGSSSEGEEKNEFLHLQLKLTPSVADVLELPETFIAPLDQSTATMTASLAMLSSLTNNKQQQQQPSSNASSSCSSASGSAYVFRAPPLKRSGTWVHPNPPPSSSNEPKETYSSGTPDEDQMLYYLRIYLSLSSVCRGGDRNGSSHNNDDVVDADGSGSGASSPSASSTRKAFLSSHLIKEASTLLATQIAFFELTQTADAKFDLSSAIAPITDKDEAKRHEELHQSEAEIKKVSTSFGAASTVLTLPKLYNYNQTAANSSGSSDSSVYGRCLLYCKRVFMPSEAIWGRQTPNSNTAVSIARNQNRGGSNNQLMMYAMFSDSPQIYQQQKDEAGTASSSQTSSPSPPLFVGLPPYDAMTLQLHDVTSFTWALKYCYGEYLRHVDANTYCYHHQQQQQQHNSSQQQSGMAFLFVPPSVQRYVNEYVKK